MNPVVWLTGLSSSGKSTIAYGVGNRLSEEGHRVSVLDADIIRQKLWPELGFSRWDREQNIERLGFLARLFLSLDTIPIVAAVSPFAEARARVRKSVSSFMEVYLRCPLEVLKKRDTKGIYGQLHRGEIRGVCGVDFLYEAPEAPELVIDTDKENIETSVSRVFEMVVGMTKA